MVGLFQCWPHPEGSRGLLHPPIEAGQPGAAAVQRHRQMQRIAGTEAEGLILEQLGRLAKAVAIKRAQRNTALQQALARISGGLTAL